MTTQNWIDVMQSVAIIVLSAYCTYLMWVAGRRG